MILLYQVPKAVYEVLENMQLPYRTVESRMLKETLGYLFQLPGFTSSVDEKQYTFDFDAMILHEVDDDTLNEMIAELKKVNANVARKAMLTKHNQHWRMGDLLEEINAEHAYFQVYDNLMLLLKRAETLHPEDYVSALWNRYQTAFINAYETLQSRPEDIHILKQAQENLQNAEMALTQSS